MEEQEQQEARNQAQPELLYHYTTQEGLLGILTDECIWATHLRYLNDLAEGKVFPDVAQMIIENKFRPERVEDKRKFSNAVRKFKNSFVSRDVFVTSFSGARDQLSQWRAYSGKAGGYSIGFDVQSLRTANVNFLSAHREQFWSDKTPFQKCEYWSERLKARVNRAIGDSTASPSQAPDSDAAQGSKTKQNNGSGFISQGNSGDLTFGFLRQSAIFKHEKFREEEEWRMIFIQQSGAVFKELQFRPGSSMPIPYIKVPLGLTRRPISIRKIIVGPCPHPNEAIRAVEMRLRSKSINGVQVLPSDIPYRNW